jgi:hypothetical protein
MTGAMTFAFGAGLLATVNPCGFVMLPGLIGMQLGSGDDDQQSPLERCADGFAVGVVLSATFTGVLVIAGIVLAAGSRSLMEVGAVDGAGCWRCVGRRGRGDARRPRCRRSWAEAPATGGLYGHRLLASGDVRRRLRDRISLLHHRRCAGSCWAGDRDREPDPVPGRVRRLRRRRIERAVGASLSIAMASTVVARAMRRPRCTRSPARCSQRLAPT